MSTGERRYRNWRDAEVADRPNDRRNNYRSTYGMDLRGTMDSRTGIDLTGIIVDSIVIKNGISSEIGVRIVVDQSTKQVVSRRIGLDQIGQSFRNSESGDRRERKSESQERRFKNGKQARITCGPETILTRKLVPDHQEERGKPKGGQSGPEQKGSRSPSRTDSSPNARVDKNRNRSRGTNDSAVKVQDEIETPESTPGGKSAKRLTEDQRVGGPHRLKSSFEMSTT
ncbi:hypothetical protein TNCV_1450471 [Trichonephila clavipes]|nr:hypothetical protein TNCV_1450471 [Trichonephila clavipes]